MCNQYISKMAERWEEEVEKIRPVRRGEDENTIKKGK